MEQSEHPDRNDADEAGSGVAQASVAIENGHVVLSLMDGSKVITIAVSPSDGRKLGAALLDAASLAQMQTSLTVQ